MATFRPIIQEFIAGNIRIAHLEILFQNSSHSIVFVRVVRANFMTTANRNNMLPRYRAVFSVYVAGCDFHAGYTV